MLGWLKILKRKFEKLPALGQFAISILIIVVVRYLLHLIIYSNYLSSYLENFGNPQELVYFHMNGCGHCTKMMPEWHAFEKENNTGVATKKLERGQAGSLIEKHKIQGFPTIMLLDNNDNKIKDYSGPRTKSGLLEFCKKV